MRMICRRLTNLQGGNLISSAVRWLTNLQESKRSAFSHGVVEVVVVVVVEPSISLLVTVVVVVLMRFGGGADLAST